MKYTIHGKTGRAQLTVRDYTGPEVPISQRRDKPEFIVRLLDKRANRNTAFSVAGDPVYRGPDFDVAMMHITAWTGMDESALPASLKRYASTRVEAAA
jgi:hypothetical protein